MQHVLPHLRQAPPVSLCPVSTFLFLGSHDHWVKHGLKSRLLEEDEGFDSPGSHYGPVGQIGVPAGLLTPFRKVQWVRIPPGSYAHVSAGSSKPDVP